MTATAGSVPIPAEAGWDTAPSLVDGAMNLTLTAADCNLDYWIRAVAQGTLAGLVGGHHPDAATPAYMRDPADPLRQALVSELGFRSVAEEKATRAIATLAETAPELDTMEFYSTQLIDEARHARVFRGHLVEMGVPVDQLDETIRRESGADIEAVLVPLEEFSAPVLEAGDFIGGVILLTVLVEGVLAPAAELSERKWRVLDPAAAQIERGAGIDEIRHLTVGSSIVKEHLVAHPRDRGRLEELVGRGQELWGKVPVVDMLGRRETLFQAGLDKHRDAAGDYEIWPGRRIVDTTVEERITQGLTWSAEMQASRMAYMGLGA